MRKIYLLLLAVLYTAFSFAQSSANYSFTTNNTGTLSADLNSNVVDMSSGTTQLVAPGLDAAASAVTTIPFDFYLMGTKFTQFSVDEDGILQLGSTTVGTNLYTISGGTAAAPRLAAFNTDLRTGTNGKIHYKIVGAAPNRALIVEFNNMQLFYTAGAAAGTSTFQMRLYETTGVIEYVYGTMSATDVATTNRAASIGFYTGATTNSFISTTFATHTSSVTSPYTANPNVAAVGPITALTSAADGNRRKYIYTPPAPAAPTALTYTSVGATGMTLNWTDNSTSELSFAVLRSTDNITFTQVATIASTTSAGTGTTYSSPQTGLAVSTTYYWKIVAISEGALSPALSGNQFTAACSVSGGTKTVGPTGTYVTLTAAMTDINLNGLAGAVILELQPAYTSGSETFPITFNPPCGSAVNTLTIRPATGAAALSITGSGATGLLNFDGGDYITIDGRAGGTGPSQLTISNTSTAGYDVQFINSATFNTIKYCTVLGVNTGTASGVIFFNTATGLPTGNSNNTIDNCDIAAGASTPTNLIFASGTATSFGSQNNNNTVSNSTLHDWFNAASTTSGAAINIINSASDWTINNNSFYQTAARVFTMTTATDQGAILIASTTNNSGNFTITNNSIGGSAALCGGAALSWSGTGITGTPTPRMLRLSTAAGAFNNITGNTLANMAFASASASTAYGLIAVLNGNTNIANNTLGSQSATGNITFLLNGTSVAPFLLPISFGTGATISTYNITNNNIGGITASAATTGAYSFRVIYGQPVAGCVVNVTGNTLGGTIANSIQQGTGTATAGVGSLFGILILNPTIGDVITNNTLRNMSVTNLLAGPSLTGINVQAGGGGHIITGNTIFNLTTSALNVAVNNAASVVGLTMTGSVVGGGSISGNTIYNLVNTNTTVAGSVLGMYFGTAPSPQPVPIISNNFIHSLKASSATGTITGIFFPNTGPASMYNNMIRLGFDGSGAAITNAVQINGISKASSGNLSLYHNTVYIGGTGVASGAVNSYAYRRTTSATGDSLMNNIFQNVRSNASGTGKHYAVSLNAATSIVSNYNDFVANGTGGVMGIINTTDYGTIPLWQAGSAGLDANSISSAVTFVNATGDASTVNLHVDIAVATPIEQAGIALANVTADYDNQTRAGLTPTDIGADANNFILLDVSPPTITYTPLITGCSTGDRTLTATITDASGVPTSGTLRPRIYYKKGAGSYFSQPGTLTSGTATNGTWSFPIVAADMGGVAVADVISYYVIAQDVTAGPNISSNPGIATATDVNNVTTPPATPNTYTISNSISGTYTVGAGGAYTTLTAAVAAYNTSCLGSAVVFSLTDATYPAETFPITINANNFASAVNTLTIRPATGISPVITGTNATSIFSMNGAKFVTIDGSNSGGTTKDLTISNTNTGGATVRFINGALNNTVKNSIITGVTTSTTNGVVFFSTSTGTTGNNNNTIQNNTITKGTTLPVNTIYNAGSAGTLVNSNNIITLNNIADFSNNGVNDAGNSLGTVYSNNQIYGTATQTTTTALYGIFLGVNTIQSPVVTGNKIYDLKTGNTSASTGYLQGIDIYEIAPGTTALIANNFVSLYPNGTTAPGIRIAGIADESTAGTANIYHNTVNLSGTSTVGSSFAYLKNFTNTTVLKDNIFSNNILSTSANKQYAILTTAGIGPFTSDYNDLYSNGNAQNALGQFNGGADVTTIAAWQAASASDAHSISVAPVYVSVTDLHLSTATGNNWCLNGAGVALAAVTTDIDGDVRSTGTAPLGPDMGADEFVPTGNGAGTPASQSICSGGTITAITYTGTGTTFAWTRDNFATAPGIAASGTGSITGSMTNATTAPITVTFTITPFNAGGCAGPTFTATVIVNPVATAAAAPSSQSICSGAAITTISLTSPTAGATFNWVRDNTAGVTGIAASGSGDISGSLTNTTAAAITVTFTITPIINTCAGTPATATVLVYPVSTATATPASQSICSGGTISTIVLSGATTYNWTRDNTVGVTGIAASGSTDISGALTNTTNADITVTFSIIPASNSCPGPAITATVLVKAPAVITPSKVEPTTCVSADGSITLALSGAPGPYSFVWTGTGVNTTAQNQTGLVAGVYSVVVTAGNLCTSSATIILNGPGGCAVCPTIPSLATNPTPATCIGSTVSLTASGLTSMGITYGITFKYYSAPAADPYAGGTTIATVANGSLTAGGTQAAASTTFAAAGTYYVYAILSPVPLDPSCRPSATATIVINPTPTVNAVTSQTACNNGSTTAVNFSGAVAGTVYNWANNTTSIGLAASGTGNIASFTALNTGTAPVVANIVVTPTYTNAGATCTGSTTNFTITVNPTATVNTVANQTLCNGGASTAVTFSSTATGGTIVYNWTNNTTAIGLGASGTGNIASFTATNTTTGPLTATITVTPSYTNNSVTCTGTPRTFTITVNPVATVNAVANQTVCNNTSTAAVTFSSPATGGTIVYNWTNNTPSIGLAASGSGNIAAFTAVNTTTSPVIATISVTASYTNGAVTCAGTVSTFTITVNPTPAATISYAGSPYCSSAGTATVTRTGTAGGVYSSTAGLSITAGTGDINLGASTAGTYTVTYTIAAAGGCAVFTTTTSVTITAAPNATIAYTASPYCINGGSAAVTRTGTAGGVYSSTAGLVIDATTGAVNLNTSTAGTYTVTYTVAASGGCALFTTTTSITINTLSVAPTGATASNPVICAGSGVTNLSVVGGTLGSGASYKWYTGSCGGTLVGTGATLTNITLFATTTFYVRAEGVCNNTTCASVTVNVNPAPVVVLTGAPSNINPGVHTILTATVSPVGNYLYTFIKNGVVIVTAGTSSSLPLTADSTGTYQVIVSNPATGCSATSNQVTITGLKNENVFVFPNPNKGQFTVSYYADPSSYGKQRSVSVYDNKGARVFFNTVTITGPYTSIAVNIKPYAAAGIYNVLVTDASGKNLKSEHVIITP